jgi:ribonuclease E
MPTPVDVDAIPVQVAAGPGDVQIPAVEPVHVAPVTLEPSPAVPPVEAELVPVATRAEPPKPAEPARPRNQPDIPPVQLSLPADSELQLVETRHHIDTPRAEDEAPRPKRTRPPRIVVSDEPLQMVETRGDSHGNPPA